MIGETGALHVSPCSDTLSFKPMGQMKFTSHSTSINLCSPDIPIILPSPLQTMDRCPNILKLSKYHNIIISSVIIYRFQHIFSSFFSSCWEFPLEHFSYMISLFQHNMCIITTLTVLGKLYLFQAFTIFKIIFHQTFWSKCLHQHFVITWIGQFSRWPLLLVKAGLMSDLCHLTIQHNWFLTLHIPTQETKIACTCSSKTSVNTHKTIVS
jgi:hypothetical protein